MRLFIKTTLFFYFYPVKKYYRFFPLLFLFACNLDTEPETLAATIYQECPPEGNAKTQDLKKLNKLKNRGQVPGAGDHDTSITLKKILLPGNDEKRWSSKKAASITGYVYEVKPGGIETCNCKTKDPDKRDTHIEILADPMHSQKMQRMIVEVTPRFREEMKKSGQNWSTRALRDKLLGRWVKFSGWLIFDAEHANQAENTRPGRESNWRATAWEIHPVTNIEVVKKP